MTKHPSPHGLTRRIFLGRTLLAGALTLPLARRALAADRDLRVAILGLGNKGGSHLRQLAGLAGARITALCDVDPERLDTGVGEMKQRGEDVFAATDPRRILDRADVDAVVIATPNHWHALLTIWAVRAGKDVYVEKPVSHSVWEGQRMVEEARATGRIVQSGTQYRSCVGLRAAAEWLRDRRLGRLKWAHIVWFEHREAIGKAAPHRPAGLDYDLWCGPAPDDPLVRPRLHYDWHWAWSTGNGDLGNSTIHPFDAARMFFPEHAFPSRIRSLGGRFAFDDAGETPNTQFTVAEYPDFPVAIEHRNLSLRKDQVVMDHLRGIREGMVLQYEDGYFAGLRGGGAVYDNEGKVVERFRGDGGRGHMANFIEAVRDRNERVLLGPIQEGHVSSAVCHHCNISYRMDQPAGVAACREAVGGHEAAVEGFDRVVASLEGIGVDLQKSRFRLGASLEVDPRSGELRALNGEGGQQLEQARCLARGSFRAPYLLPTG